MPAELIIDTHTHVYRTAENGRQAMENFACPLGWEGSIDELRALMREIDIWRTVIGTITPTQAMREKALAQLPADLSREAREKAEIELRERLLQRMDHNNLWGCEAGGTYPELLPFINLDPVLMDAVTIRQKVMRGDELLVEAQSCLADLRNGPIVPTADPRPVRRCRPTSCRWTRPLGTPALFRRCGGLLPKTTVDSGASRQGL